MDSYQQQQQQQEETTASGPLPELSVMTTMQLRRFAQCMQLEKLDLQNEFDICREKYEADVGKLVEKIRSQEILLASIRTSASNSSKEVERLTAENSALADRAQVLEGEVRSVNAANEEMRIDIKTVHDLQNRVKHLTSRCQELEDECDSLRTTRSMQNNERTVESPPKKEAVVQRSSEAGLASAVAASPSEIEELVALLEKSTGEVERLQDQVALWRRRGEEAEKEVEKLKLSLEENYGHYVEDGNSQPSFTASTTPESTAMFATSAEADAGSSLRGSMDSHTAERAENELLHFLLEGAANSQEIESIREEFLATSSATRRRWPSSVVNEVSKLRSALEAAEASSKVLRERVKELEEELKQKVEIEMTLESALSGEEEKSKTVLVTQSSGGVNTSPVERPEMAEIGTSPVKKLPNRIEGSCQTSPRVEEKEEDSGDDNTVCSAEDVEWLKREVRRLKQEAVDSAKCATNKLRSARDQLSAREVDLARAQRAGEMAEIRIGEIDRELREAVEKLREEMTINERLETKLKLMVAQLSLARSESSGLRDEVVRRRKMMEKMDEREARSVVNLERSGMASADTEGLLLKMEEQTANLAEDTERFLEEYARVCLNEERERMISNDLYGHLIRAEERRRDLQRVAGVDVNREEVGQIVERSEVELYSSREEVEGQPQDVVILQSQARLSGVADSIDFGSDQMRALTEYVERMSAEYARVCIDEEREKMISNDLYAHLVRVEERRKDLQRVAGDVAAKTDVVLMREGWNRERREMMREDREGHLEALVEALVDLQASREIKAVEHSTTRLLSVGVQTMRVARWNSVVQASPRVAEVGVQSRIEMSTVESQTNGVGKRNRSISRLTQTAAADSNDDDRAMLHPVDAEHKAAIREEAIREIKAHMEEQVRITRCNGQVRLRAREESYRAEVERLGREHQRATAELERRHAEDLRVQRLRLERQWQVRRSMAEMSKKKETREAAVVPQPLRIDEDMLVTPRDEIRSSSSFNMHQVFDERPSPNAIRRASAARVVESVRSGRRRVIERTLRPK